jgi:hypothetical protein
MAGLSRYALSLIAIGSTMSFALAAHRTVQAAEFILKNGGRIEGKWINEKEAVRRTYVIDLAVGGRIMLNRSQVSKVIKTRPIIDTYEVQRHTVPDTVEGHLKMASWCRVKHLAKQRLDHLQRILELDPNHKKARAALGYHQVNGRWVTTAEENQANGMRRYKGSWRSAQEIELLEERKQREGSERKWFSKVKRWRKELEQPKKFDEARKNLTSITSPTAVKAIALYLDKETVRDAKLIYYKALAGISAPPAMSVLMKESIDETDGDLRLTALDYVVDQKTAAASKFYIQKLKNKDNRKVNRAGLALGLLKDPVAVRPLIDALLTTHRYQITKGKGGPNSQSHTFGTGGGGGGGYSFGGGGPKMVKATQKNRSVLDALYALTGENLSYDKTAWKRWYNSQRKNGKFNARRD